ncbi:MAG: bacillithiol system redox-active protein YtxJ [Flavobacteriaceae bacterium]|nr:bacillithiol system redox-active protein YtxJ [Flavobacteriaceae bacterium]
MGIFDSMFKPDSKPLWPGVSIQSKADLEGLLEKSFIRSQLIFKHSTRCSISRYVLSDFIAHYTFSSDELESHYLDLLNYREISNQIADQLEVAHQSPQILLIKNGKAVVHASHEGITELQLSIYL